MSNKKQKQRCTRKSPGGPEPIPFPHLEAGTITGRHEEYERLCGGKLAPEQACRFISLENAKALVVLGSGENEETILREQCLAFYKFFLERYRQDKPFLDCMKKHFHRQPLILRIGEAAFDEEYRNAFPFNEEFRLTKAQERARDALTEYVLKHNTGRFASFTISSSEDEACEQYFFPDDLSGGNLDEARQILQNWISAALTYGGGLVTRFPGIGTGGKDIINGFSFQGGKVSKLDAEAMRDCHEAMPDGRREEDPTAEYRTPFVFLG